MTFLLDTDTCIYIMKQHPAVVRRLAQIAPEDVAVSSITVSELDYGVKKSQQKKSNQEYLDQFLAPLQIIPYDLPASKAYGTIRATIEQQGSVIGPLDMLVAAHAISQNLTLVTNNEREFRRVNELVIDNWAL